MGFMDYVKNKAKAAAELEKQKALKGKKPGERQVDDSPYQECIDCYEKGNCPYCKAQLNKISKKSDCPSCGEGIINERHFSTKKPMLLTKEQADKLAVEKKHYEDLKWAVRLAEEIGLSRKEIAGIVKSTQVNTKFSVLYVKANDLAMNQATKAKWLSYRNTRLSMAEIVERDGHFEKALEFYLAVCFLDLNGPSDEGTFQAEGASVSRDILKKVRDIVKALELEQDTLKEKFTEMAGREKNRFMEVTPQEAWERFIKTYNKLV